MTIPKKRGGRRIPGTGKRMGAPALVRPPGSAQWIMTLYSTPKQKDAIMDALPRDLVERAALLLKMIEDNSVEVS